MKTLLTCMVLVTTLFTEARAQVVVTPNERPIIINIGSKSASEDRVETVTESDRLAELTKQVEALTKQVEALTKKQMVQDEAEAPSVELVAYPTKPVRQYWNMGSIPMNKRNLVRHLLGEIGDTQHKGTFAREYLEFLASLPDGFERLRALHSDDHDNVVRNITPVMFSNDKEPARTSCNIEVVPKVRYYYNCPNGYCPRR